MIVHIMCNCDKMRGVAHYTIRYTTNGCNANTTLLTSKLLECLMLVWGSGQLTERDWALDNVFLPTLPALHRAQFIQPSLVPHTHYNMKDLKLIKT